MKKLFYSFLCIFLILIVGNFVLRYLHIKEIKNKIDNITSKLADIDITLEINELVFNGWDFWNIFVTTENIEIYTTISQSVFYFNIPKIDIDSKFIGFNTILTKVFLTETLSGYISLNDILADKLKINTDYKIFLSSPRKFLINSLIKDLWGINNQTEIAFQSETLSCSTQDKNSNYKDKLFDIQNITIHSKIFDQDLKKWEFSNAIKGLDIYLPMRFLSATTSIDDAKDISVNIDIKKDTKIEDKKTFNEYQGSLDIVNKVFNINIYGKNINRQKKSGHTANKADLHFKIKHLQKLIEYITNIIINVKKQENPHYDGSQAIEISNLFAKIIMENSMQESNDVVTFNIKDVDKSTLFNGKVIEEIFSPVIEKAKAM